MHFNAEQISTGLSCDLFLVRVELGINGVLMLCSLLNKQKKPTPLITAVYWLQAFLEMASEEAAVAMVNYYSAATPLLHSQPVYIQYSNHRELKTDNLPNQAVSIRFPCNRIELHVSYVLDLARIELIFFTVACDTYIASRPLLCLTAPCQWECTRGWEGAQLGQLTSTNQRNIPHHMALCSAMKAGGKRMKVGHSELCHFSSQVNFMSDGDLLSWKWLNTCLPMRSSNGIPYFALLAHAAFS